MPATFTDGSCLAAEFEVWVRMLKSLKKVPDNIQDTLHTTNAALFPLLHCLIRLVCTFPITSCETERSVSTLRRLKTYMRSTMGQERLSALALIHVHYSMDINLEEVLARFLALHPRRVAMHDLLKD